MIKGILFDKDGTLIDFFSLWMGAAKAVVIQFLKENELSEEVKERVFYAMGIENGEIYPLISPKVVLSGSFFPRNTGFTYPRNSFFFVLTSSLIHCQEVFSRIKCVST